MTYKSDISKGANKAYSGSDPSTKANKIIYTPALYASFPLTVTRAQGPYLYAIPTNPTTLDKAGKAEEKKYLDFTAGIAVLALGHANPKCAEIMYKQALEVGKHD